MSTVAAAGDGSTVQHGAEPARVPARAVARRRNKPAVPVAAALSVALHLAMAVLLITHSFSSGVHKPRPRTVVLISLESLRDSGDPQAAHPDTAHPSPKLAPVPVPDAQAAPKPRRAPAPLKPAQAVAQPKAQAPAAQPKQSEAPAQAEKRGEEGESIGISVLNQVRTNWLKPVGSSQSFRCRLRIDYLAGGFIANVVVLAGCGTNPLDDSVERAVWKTQPLPLGPSQTGPGSMVLEFSP